MEVNVQIKCAIRKRIGNSGKISSISKAALSTIRRAPQLEQNPRRLQATRRSALTAGRYRVRQACSSRIYRTHGWPNLELARIKKKTKD